MPISYFWWFSWQKQPKPHLCSSWGLFKPWPTIFWLWGSLSAACKPSKYLSFGFWSTLSKPTSGLLESFSVVLPRVYHIWVNVSQNLCFNGRTFVNCFNWQGCWFWRQLNHLGLLCWAVSHLLGALWSAFWISNCGLFASSGEFDEIPCISLLQ